MEITRPYPLNKDGQNKGGKQTKNDEEARQSLLGDNSTKKSGWAENNAFKLYGITAEVTPEIAVAFENLTQKIEPLRQKLEYANTQIEALRKKMGQHIFLPIPNRREFIRELTYLISQSNYSINSSSLLMMHFYSLDNIRQKLGRKILDEALMHVAQIIGGALGPNDIFGCVGGNDFAAVIVTRGAISIDDRFNKLTKAFTVNPFISKEIRYSVEPRIGSVKMVPHLTAEDAIYSADLNLVSSQINAG